MKKFTVIAKDSSKWLSRTAPHGVDPIQWHSGNHDLPYIGSAEPGTSLSEEQVREVKQTHHKDEDSDYWYTSPSQTHTEFAEQRPDYTVRTVYTDAESHDRHISEDYWRKRCEAAESLLNAEAEFEHNLITAEEYGVIREEWEQIVKQEQNGNL